MDSYHGIYKCDQNWIKGNNYCFVPNVYIAMYLLTDFSTIFVFNISRDDSILRNLQMHLACKVTQFY